MAPIIVQATLSIAGSILLSPASASSAWASAAHAGVGFYGQHRPAVFPGGLVGVRVPGFAIMLTILSLNLLGDGLRDALDPKLKN